MKRNVRRLAWAGAITLAAGCGQSPTAPRALTLSLPGGFAASPPVIQSITVPTTRREAGTDIQVTAAIEDRDPPEVSQLVYQWSTNVGTISGSGPTAIVRIAPGILKGVDVVVSLTVIKRFTGKGTGQSVLQEFRVSGQSASFRVHDSVAELKELSRKFLIDLFGNSAISPQACLVDFSENGPCKQGKADELQDLINHRKDYLVLDKLLISQTVVFTGTDTALVNNHAWFKDQKIATGVIGTTEGNFPLTAVYETARWWLCSSGFDDDLRGDGGLATIKRMRRLNRVTIPK